MTRENTVSCAYCGRIFDKSELGWARYQEHVESRHPNANPHTSMEG